LKNSPWKVASYLLVIIIGLLVALPNVLSDKTLSQWPSFLPSHKVSLGLDLRGGSHLVLEVDRPSLENEWLQSLTQEARTSLREASIETRSITRQSGSVVVTVAEPARRDAARDILAKLSSPVATGLGAGSAELDITIRGADAILVAPSQAGISYRMSNAVDQSLEIIRQRVDQVGVAEPTIQRVGADRASRIRQTCALCLAPPPR
jgi:SecD/SecF fusion protein